MIGDRAEAITYIKGQRHACDPQCKAAGHRYRHVYKKTVPIMAGSRKEITVPAREFIRRDGAREHYAVDNPPLLIVNGPERRKKVATIRMKRNRKGQFVAAGRAAPKKARKKKSRRNPPWWTAGAVVNSPKAKKRKKARRYVAGRKKYRRNPPTSLGSFAGIPLAMPEITDVLGIAGGLAGPPMVKGFAMQLLPASVTTTTVGKWGVEAGSYVLPVVAGYMIGGRRAVRNVIAGELAGVAVRLVQQVTASISANIPALNGYTRSGARALGGYTGPVSRRQLANGSQGDNPAVYWDPPRQAAIPQAVWVGRPTQFAATRQSPRVSRFTGYSRWGRR